MKKRKLEYADITHISETGRNALLVNMQKGHTVITTVQEWRGSGAKRKQVNIVHEKVYPALYTLWIEQVGGRWILFGYMFQEECPVRFLSSRPRTMQRQMPHNGGLITEEEYV